jgi:hypothetical protein
MCSTSGQITTKRENVFILFNFFPQNYDDFDDLKILISANSVVTFYYLLLNC